MNVNDLKIVLKVAEQKSIKQAAESMDLLVATASAAVKRVETSLGVTLFQRSTRKLKITSAGEQALSQLAQAVALLNQVEQQSKHMLGTIEGEIRLSAPSDLGRNILLEWLDAFMDSYSKVSLKLHVSDSNVDFYRAPLDVALRYIPYNNESVYGFKICDVPRVVCASPAYLAQCGRPEHPADLTSHNSLLYELKGTLHHAWTFTRNGEKFPVRVGGNRAANDADLVRRWCVSGKGIAMKSALDMSTDLLSGRVVPILQEFTAPPTELWLICPSRQLITPAIRKLREHLTQHCQHLLDSMRVQGLIR